MSMGYIKRREPDCPLCEIALGEAFAAIEREEQSPDEIAPKCGHIWDRVEYPEVQREVKAEAVG